MNLQLLTAKRENPVEKTVLSEKARKKKDCEETEEGLQVQSFETLMEVLSTHSMCVIQPKIKGASSFEKYTEPTELQMKAYELLGVRPSS